MVRVFGHSAQCVRDKAIPSFPAFPHRSEAMLRASHDAQLLAERPHRWAPSARDNGAVAKFREVHSSIAGLSSTTRIVGIKSCSGLHSPSASKYMVILNVFATLRNTATLP